MIFLMICWYTYFQAKAKGKKLPNIALHITPNSISATLLGDGNGNTNVINNVTAMATTNITGTGVSLDMKCDKKRNKKTLSSMKKYSKKPTTEGQKCNSDVTSISVEPILADEVAKIDLKSNNDDNDDWCSVLNETDNNDTSRERQQPTIELFNISIYR